MDLKKFADEIRLYTMKELNNRGFGHYGGSLSIIETLAVLYGKEMNIDAAHPDNENRDYFVLSKGHAGPSLYATLFLKGYISEETLMSLNNNGTNLPSHPDKNLTKGIDVTTGSLGQGLSVATGVAYGNKLKGLNNYTYCIVGDGELNEGQCWEAIQFANHHKLHNLILFVDDNKKQLDGYTKDINNPMDFVTKMQAFGLNSFRINGNNISEVEEAITKAKENEASTTAIIMDTIKGYGVTAVEKIMNNHHLRPDCSLQFELERAVLELENKAKGQVPYR
ncbi:transketolase [Vagococcus elongatus]|uniref:Transketolase n=1 Tax=Vagococcus elongatus TaxID=180344 RepID=A0A430B0Z7_9ENTE|nr:transketolase [Vagococcus elongatus]RSU14010.1 transketolase [Vagococcus elongatus]